MLKNLNENQSKHIANSLRMLGVGQFVFYGVEQLKADTADLTVLLVSGIIYALMEILSVYTLKGK